MQLIPAAKVWVEGQVNVGAVLSSTVTLVVQVLVFVPSVAVRVTVVTPVEIEVPAAGFWVAVTFAQLLLMFNPVTKSGTREVQLASDSNITGAGQSIIGVMLSSIVTVDVQLFVLPELSVTVKVTVFDPRSVQSKLVLSMLKPAIPQLSADPLFTSSAEI